MSHKKGAGIIYKLKSKFVKWLTGFNPETFDAYQTILKAQINIESEELKENYLFDFKNFASQYNNNSNSFVLSNPTNGLPNISGKTSDITSKIKRTYPF